MSNNLNTKKFGSFTSDNDMSTPELISNYISSYIDDIITDELGTDSKLAASLNLVNNVSSTVETRIDNALTNYTAYELDGDKIQLKNMKLVKYHAIYEDKTADPFDFYVLKKIN